jgi:hypothetical protein
MVVKRMLPEDLFVAPRFAFAPMWRKHRKQLNLPLEKNSSAVLMLDTMCEFVFQGETKSYALEDVEEEFVHVIRREAFEFLPALDYDVVIAMLIDFNVRACAVL